MAPKPVSLEKRFYRFVERGGSDECWLWTGARHPKGYGRIRQGGRGSKTLLAHRVSFELHKRLLKPGENACHRCDNPPCVNPNHLFAGSQKDNIIDREAKGRSADRRGEKGGGSKLTENKVVDIISDPRTHSKIAEDYDVSRSLVSAVKAAKCWRHIGVP